MIILPIGDVNSREKFPYVTYLLIVTNCVIFFIWGFGNDYEKIVLNYGLIPEQTQPFTFITSIFLHGSILHLFGNMLYLWICGDNVEDKLGHFSYLALYLFSGITAGLFHWQLNLGSDIPTIGASGAIAGVLGAYLILFPKSRIKFWYFFWIFIFIRTGVFYLATIWALGFWFIEQLLLVYFESANKLPSGVAYWAHIGGFTFGVLIALFLRFTGLVQTKRKSYYD